MTAVGMRQNPIRRVPDFLPAGRPLGDAAFELRHRGLLVLLWVHVPALVAFALVRGFDFMHALFEGALVATFAVVATMARGQRTRSVAAALGLVISSAVLVHLWGGAIEGHFHFFVMLTFLALYQSWLPFLAALGFVVLEHGIVGAMSASSVYGHAAGSTHPWRWALIHGGFVLASCVGNLLAWRLTEDEALHDGLTGLANRRLLLDCLEARQRSRHARTAMLYLDLDDFKDANDGFGHNVGDELLIAVAGRLSARLAPDDLLARLGGDEFAVMLTAPSEAGATAAAQRLLTAFDHPFAIAGLSIVTSASAGIAIAGPDSTPLSLLRDSDLAMYEAKRAGGGRCVTFDVEMHAAVAQRSALINELPRALRENEFVVHYQPVFRLSDNAVIGTEALVRWEHPTRGLVPPAEFIEAAEQSGFIVPLGLHVLRTACHQTVEWQRAYPGLADLVMSVNLSPRQLSEPDLLSVVTGVLAATGLPAASLCLEVTESAVIRDLDETVPTLQALSAVGIRLALDDFGTGYSSLSYLQRMPVHVLKVDRSFVGELATGTPGTAIVRAVVDLAHELGLAVTAEGIETDAQLELLRTLGCDAGQGFLKARPMPANELARWLAAERVSATLPLPRDRRHSPFSAETVAPVAVLPIRPSA